MTELEQAFEAQARSMRDFGFTDVTAATIKDHYTLWRAGRELPGDPVFGLSRHAFNTFPDIFGPMPKDKR
ncbi:hypothetical protein [Ensifer sp. LCM 4579]|uniref:hypothetical protein n=1 Tax=Ensifer sp. LCM 4579 TaxID=1848292 RepID=UPI0008D926FF|nr:hypothetical protein [Ensifer sp. LCM 4579]OHV73359.1 hypothetical protein LCM4579_10585 [Ensifer sp. LCM 4579]